MEHKNPKVLIVDDIEMNVTLLGKMIEKMGYEPMLATNAEQAIALVNEELPSIILLDIVMPGVDGYQLCEMFKEYPITREIPVIFISAMEEMADHKKAFDIGAVDFIQKPYEYGEVAMRVNTQLKMYLMRQQMEENNERLNMVVQEQARKLESEQKRLLRAFSKFAEGHQYVGIGHHMEYVAYNARLLAQALNFTNQYENQISTTFVEAIEIASAIHDIGKITVPKEIVMKPGPLTDREMEIMRSHTVSGYELLHSIYSDIDENVFVQMALDIVLCHHERWDGTGYPKGLAGEEIPLAARIMSIVDSYDSMMGERCYKTAMTREEALEAMHDDHGHRYDPYILEVFFKIERQLKKEPQMSEASVHDGERVS